MPSHISSPHSKNNNQTRNYGLLLEKMSTIFKQHFNFDHKLRVFGLLSYCIDDDEENFFKVNLNIDNSSDYSNGEDEHDGPSKLKIVEETKRSSSPPTLPPSSISPVKLVNGHSIKIETPRKNLNEYETALGSERNRRKLRRPLRKSSHANDSELSAPENENEDQISSPIQSKKSKQDSSEALATDSSVNLSTSSPTNQHINICNPNLATMIAASQQVACNSPSGATLGSSVAITGPDGQILGHLPHSSLNILDNNLAQSQAQPSAGITFIQGSPFNSIRGLNLSPSISGQNSQGVTFIGNLQAAQNSVMTEALLKQMNMFKSANQATMISTISPNPSFGINLNPTSQTPTSVVATSTANIDMNAIAHALATNKLTATPGPIPGQIVLSCPRQASSDLSFLGSGVTTTTTPTCTTVTSTGSDKPIALIAKNTHLPNFTESKFPDEASIERILQNLRQKGVKSDEQEKTGEKQPLRTVTYANLDNRRFNTAQMFRPGDGIVETAGGTIIYESGLKAYRCHFCGKTFNRKFCRERHERLHTGQKPYDCLLCNLKFIRLEDRKRHLRSDQHIEAVAEKARLICAKSGGTWEDEKAVIIRMLTEEFDRDSSVDFKDLKIKLRSDNSQSDGPDDTRSVATDENNPLEDASSVKSDKQASQTKYSDSDSVCSTPVRLVVKSD